ncbi:MAG: AAA family ATPase, partial [Candidatus Micrarchaeota archaeon]|nr:AAA family ATPase [Candidatus Micrarchaeota archaeon]
MIVIMGLPGVGKSTVLKELIKINKKIAVLNYGDIVFSLAKMKFNVSNRDQINLMPVENHKMIQKEAIKEIKSANSKESKLGKLLILDTHAAIKKPTSYLPGLTYDLLSSVPIEAFIFIDAPTHEIIERRENDLKRKRIPLNADDINNLREVSLSFINVYAAATGKPYYVVINRKGKMKET